MHVHHNLEELPTFQNAVVTVGSYDGVHQGHQQILEKINKLAAKVDGESVVITFHPHPRLFLNPDDDTIRLITTIDEKVKLLSQYGIDHLVIVPFDKSFSSQTPEAYINNFLIDKFNPAYIVIGYDHRFGKGRVGDISYLKKHAESASYEVIEIDKQEIDDIAVSSTKVRLALVRGDVKTAAHLLGHPFTITGTVVHGQSIGRSLGFPTANIEVHNRHKLIPPQGIYAVRITHQDTTYHGMLYIGTRPTLEAYNNLTIEVNIFDFDRDIYGDQLTISFIDFIRHDKQLSGLEALKAQLAEDKIAVIERIKINSLPEKKTKVEKNFPEVAIIILNYNGLHFLRTFLPILDKTTYQNYRIIIADNGSTDDSLNWLAENRPDLECIDLKENYGFAEGYNQAIKYVESDYFVLLNSDVEVTPSWLEPLVEILESDPNIAACQPKILAQKNKQQFEYAGASGGWIDKWGYPFCRGRLFFETEKDQGQYDEVQEIFWATGAAMVIRPQLMKNLGGFDGDYFAHLEEIDLCWRMQRAGFKIMVEPKSMVYHVGGGTLDYNSPRKAYLNFRNSLYTLIKNEPKKKLYWLIPLRLILDGLAGLLFLSEGKFAHVNSILRAHIEMYKNFGKLKKKRMYYFDLIQKYGIGQKNKLGGVYNKSIVWSFYGRRKRKFSDLKIENHS